MPEACYLRPRYVLEVLTHVTTPIWTTPIPISEAVLFGELPGRYSPAGAAEDIGISVPQLSFREDLMPEA